MGVCFLGRRKADSLKTVERSEGSRQGSSSHEEVGSELGQGRAHVWVDDREEDILSKNCRRDRARL